MPSWVWKELVLAGLLLIDVLYLMKRIFHVFTAFLLSCPLVVTAEIDKCRQILFEAAKAEAEARRPVRSAAQKAFGEGLRMPIDDAIAVEETKKALLTGLTIFDGAFVHGDKIIRVAVLKRDSLQSPWDVHHVHPSAKVENKDTEKLIQIRDALKTSEIEPRKYFLIYINKDFRPEHDEVQLLISEDATQKVAKWKTKKSSSAPEKKASDDEVEESEFPDLSVMHIPWIVAQKRKSLLAKGIEDYEAVLQNYSDLGLDLTPQQIRFLKDVISDKRFVDVEAMRAELASWDLANPIVYLDFETASPAIPRYPNTAPFQQVPFQFSVETGGKHFEYLHESATDPRPDLIVALLRSIPEKGSVVAYSKSFESARLKEMAEAFPAHSKALLQIEARLVDPLPVLRKSFYDVKQKGSYSIKKVAPALFGKGASYEGLPVADGAEAQIGFDLLISGQFNAADSAQLKRDLLDYCAKDTYQMRLVVEWLLETSKVAP